MRRAGRPLRNRQRDWSDAVVIVIGGTSGAGKTKLANTLMRSLGIPYVSVDHLMMGICRSNEHCGFTPMSDVSIINHHVWPIVREMIKTNIENGHSVIFEGFQILPHNINDFSDAYASQLLPLFVTLAPDYIHAHYESILEHRSAIELRSDIDDQTTLMRMSAELIDACHASSARCHAIASDYETEMRRIAHEIASAFLAGLGGRAAAHGGRDAGR